MRAVWLSLFLLFSTQDYLMAQNNDEAEIKTVINALFEGMKSSDSAKVRSLFAPGAIMQTIKVNAQGWVVVQDVKPEDFAKSIALQPKGALDEQISFGSFFSDGLLATVSTPYQFYYQGNFSHCGTNAFQLVKFSDGWKIQYIIDTRKKQGCE